MSKIHRSRKKGERALQRGDGQKEKLFSFAIAVSVFLQYDLIQ